MVTSDTSRLYYVGSEATFMLGGRYAVFGAPKYAGASDGTQTATVSQRWVIEPGTGTMPTSGSTNYTFQHTYATNGPGPFVFAELSSATSYANKVIATLPGATTVTFNNYLVSSGSSAAPSGGTYRFQFLILGLTT